MALRSVLVLGLIAGAGLSAMSRQSAVPVAQQYQNRGRYNEGVRASLSTVPTLDLVGAVVDYDEPSTSLPSRFQLAFYLPIQAPVNITVRESENRFYYWLDGVMPRSPWQVMDANVFAWSTDTVVKPLVAGGRALSLADLTAVVRLASSNDREAERILPAVLFHTRVPTAAISYRFAFRATTPTRFQFTVSPQTNRQVVCSGGSRTDATATDWLVCPAPSWADGWYDLRITAFSEDTNTERKTTMSFFHKRNIAQAGLRMP